MPAKVCIVKMVFPVVMYGCESWTIKNTEHQRIAAFELWCWGSLLRVPWTARRSKQWIRKEINPEYSLEGLVLKLKLQYSGHPMRRADSLGNTLMLGKIEGKRRRGWQRIRWLDGIIDSWTWVWANSGRCWRTGRPSMLYSMGLQRVGYNWVTEEQGVSNPHTHIDTCSRPLEVRAANLLLALPDSTWYLYLSWTPGHQRSCCIQ